MPVDAAVATAPQSAPEHALSSRAELGPVALAFLGDINACITDEQVNLAVKRLWGLHAAGKVTDEEATFLNNAAQSRRPARGAAADRMAVGRIAGREARAFTARRYQRTPNPDASRRRRRTLGGSGALPDRLRGCYTEGQRAVLCIIALNSKGGICDLPIDRIAALAGVCRTTVQSTILAARRLGHLVSTERPQPGRKSLTNLVRIVSAAWLKWIGRGAAALRRIGSNLDSEAHPTETEETSYGSTERAERPQGAWEGKWRRSRTQNENGVPADRPEILRGCR